MKRAILMALIMAWFGILQADDTSARFLWEQANARMAAARAPEEYLIAARGYNQLIGEGVRNGPLFFNLGTALLLAGDGENAAAAFRRAERYQGCTPDIRMNLRQALTTQPGQADNDLPWDHVVFFWHYDEPLRVRAWLALSGWLLLWSGLLLRRITHAKTTTASHELAPRVRLEHTRSFANSFVFFGVFLVVVFVSSAGFSLLQEQMDDRAWSERTFASKSVTPEQTP